MPSKRRITYRPSKGQGIFGLVWGGIFVLIGLFAIIPAFGAFGVLWTVLAIVMTAYQGYAAFGKGYKGPEIHIEDEQLLSSEDETLTARLVQLQSLYDQGLITREEYDEKRREILTRL